MDRGRGGSGFGSSSGYPDARYPSSNNARNGANANSTHHAPSQLQQRVQPAEGLTRQNYTSQTYRYNSTAVAHAGRGGPTTPQIDYHANAHSGGGLAPNRGASTPQHNQQQQQQQQFGGTPPGFNLSSLRQPAIASTPQKRRFTEMTESPPAWQQQQHCVGNYQQQKQQELLQSQHQHQNLQQHQQQARTQFDQPRPQHQYINDQHDTNRPQQQQLQQQQQQPQHCWPFATKVLPWPVDGAVAQAPQQQYSSQYCTPLTQHQPLPMQRVAQHQAAPGIADVTTLHEASRQLGNRTSSYGPAYSRLSAGMVEMAEELTPSRKDSQDKVEALGIVRRCAFSAYPEFQNSLQVLPFGSFVTGLGTKDSDLDIVLTGIRKPSSEQGFYDRHERPEIARYLDRLAKELRKNGNSLGGIRTLIVIRTARFPIIRLTSLQGLVLDMSIGTAGGADAAKYIKQRVESFPAVRPLVLTLKAYLKLFDLNDVSQGGLASYGLTFMVMAHLQMEGKAGNDTNDLGYMLHRFCQRYGPSYDPYNYAISVKAGGVVPRAQLDLYSKNPDRIATVDPLTGRDCTEGCYRSGEVLNAFRHAARRLDALSSRFKDRCPASVNMLEKLMSSDDCGDD